MLLISQVGVLPQLQSISISMKDLTILLNLLSLAAADVNTMTDKILKDILKDYNRDARPVGNTTNRKLFTKIIILE